jgi:hypothetical protein
MRNEIGSVASGWVSDCAIADLVGDDPTDALVPTRAPTAELALVGALLAVAIGDLQRGDPDARAWVAGNEPEPGPAFSVEFVAEVLGVEVAGLRARIMRAADLGSTPRRNPFGDTRRRRAA